VDWRQWQEKGQGITLVEFGNKGVKNLFFVEMNYRGGLATGQKTKEIPYYIKKLWTAH